MKLEEIIGGISPFADHLGIRVTRFGDGAGECELQIQPTMRNRHQAVHGGVIYSLADVGMGVALHSLLGEKEYCSTIEIKMTYLKSAAGHQLICRTRVLRKGRSIAVLEAEVLDRQVLVAKGLGTFVILRGRGAPAGSANLS